MEPLRALMVIAEGEMKLRRAQNPKVARRKKQAGKPWFFRAAVRVTDASVPGGVRSVRKYYKLGPSEGDDAVSRFDAETLAQSLLQKINASNAGGLYVTAGGALLRDVAAAYEIGFLGRTDVAEPTRQKEKFYLTKHIVPTWGAKKLAELVPQPIEDWLYATFTSWWTRHGVKAIMARLYHYAEKSGLWPEGKPHPLKKVKLGPKRRARVKRILTIDEIAKVFSLLDPTTRMVIEICNATGARISEVLGLQRRHYDPAQRAIFIEQRVWRMNVSRTKSEASRRMAALGDINEQFSAWLDENCPSPGSWVFAQGSDIRKPIWDSGIRDALHQAAQAAGCDFAGLGPHSFRRANITYRQKIGGAQSIEAQLIAGHTDMETTAEYTLVDVARQEETILPVQARIREAEAALAEKDVVASAPMARGSAAVN